MRSGQAKVLLQNLKEKTFIREGIANSIKLADSVVCSEEITELRLNQEETDTRIILYCLYAKEQAYQEVLIRTPDSNVFFILLY